MLIVLPFYLACKSSYYALVTATFQIGLSAIFAALDKRVVLLSLVDRWQFATWCPTRQQRPIIIDQHNYEIVC